jgi:acyl-coenzyme A synthetase/AMP-(fatty) acid ligase
MIKVKGISVAPAELEDLLLGHPMVEDVAVSGISDDYTGERPKAYVVLKPTFRLKNNACTLVTLAQELIDYVQENKVRHKWIVEIEILDEIPKSASGKILRRILRKLEYGKDGKDRLIARRQKIRPRL